MVRNTVLGKISDVCWRSAFSGLVPAANQSILGCALFCGVAPRVMGGVGRALVPADAVYSTPIVGGIAAFAIEGAPRCWLAGLSHGTRAVDARAAFPADRHGGKPEAPRSSEPHTGLPVVPRMVDRAYATVSRLAVSVSVRPSCLSISAW